MRNWTRGVALVVMLLILAATLWFALTPQVEVMFARNLLLYRAESFWRGTPSSASGQLSGRVLNQNGEAIEGATVVAADEVGHTFVSESDGAGTYTLTLPRGAFVPMATRAGYDDATPRVGPFRRTIFVAPNATVRADFVMQRAPSRIQTADDSPQFFDEAVVHTDVPAPPSTPTLFEVRRRGFSFVRAGTVLTASYVYEPLAEGRYPILLFIYPCGAYPCSTLMYDILSKTMAAQGYVVVTFSPQRGVNIEDDIADILKLIAHTKAGQLSSKGEASKLALFAGSLTSIHVWRAAQLAPPETIQAIVILGGASDIFLLRQRFESNELLLEPQEIYDLVSYALIGMGRPNVQPELYVRYSVVYHLDALPPIPIALMHGVKDKTVPFEQTPHLSDAMSARGIAHERYDFPNQEHYLQFSPPTPDQMDMLEEVVTFLQRSLH